MRLALLLAIALLAGCLERGGEDDVGAPTPTTTTPEAPTPASPTPTPPTQEEEGPLGLRTLGHGQLAGTREHARLVFTQRDGFVEFWARVREGDEPAPEVDFSQATVVAAVADALPNACWGLRITNATEEEGATTVEVTTYRPPPDMICAQLITYPWHVVSIDGAQREVEFVEREAVGPAPSSEDEEV